ncbi:MAG TPA: CocE/NonD family hydrolase [Acidimicrobiales bacterium]|nr:CocE/NonD family hydrolase [Acidimicrobiales bacterium]
MTQSLSFTADDGVVLHASVGSFGSLARRPLIVEDSPYAPDASTLDWSGNAYNYVELQWRGTGLSGGSLDSTGSRDQQDLSEFLGWACRQSWSDGDIGLYGFSASSIVVYNAMHLPLPCVKAAALMSGTVDLYRDLLYIGGIPSPVVGSAVEGLILEPWIENLLGRTETEPATTPGSVGGLALAPAQVGANMTEDSFWEDRTFKGDPNHIPVLADNGFYDVEEAGAFGGFLDTKADGSHLIVMGAHDGFSAGTPGPFPYYTEWFDHYLRYVDNGVQDQPVVQADLSNGSREQFLDDKVTEVTGAGWPLPQTRWTDLYLSPAKSGSVDSINDGTLAFSAEKAGALQSYPFVPSEATETDVHSVAAVAGDGIDQASAVMPPLTNMDLSGATSLTYTTPPLKEAVNAVGPVGLDLYASSSAPLTDLVAVVADVWPDGTAYPVATGWLRSSYPQVDLSKSLVDSAGDIVDPYNVFSSQSPAFPGAMRQYHIEVLPIGNHFAAGHRIRLYILGSPADMQGSPPGLDTLSIGGMTLSRLIFPTVGTSLATALGK